ncbi:hypothetical protein QZM22_24030 [Burkholderia oklahomensis]|uniref:hypothetical protein n=1 Tax=Burkholderia oklahomensis TaxID=342113 RepID=UPI00264E4603|nr:hypothetical protein [Burkholderia oklahomensis]MDN7675495.1 hypothetical protein [Burkholderia oklahomensis]
MAAGSARRVALIAQARELTRMVSVRDWGRAAQVQARLQPLLDACRQDGGPDRGEREALAHVRRACEGAMTTAAGESDALARRLEAMRARKDGWIAYSVINGLEDNET